MIDFLTRVLFESLPWLLFFCGVALAAALAAHRSRGSLASRWVVWITLAVCTGLVVLQWVVVTEREALELTVRTMAKAVDDGDVGTIREYVDADFRLGNEGREGFMDSVNRILQAYNVEKARIYGFKADIDGDAATVKFGAFCDVQHGSEVQYNFHTQWQLHFGRRAGRWLLDRIDQARWRLPIGESGGGDLVPYIR